MVIIAGGVGRFLEGLIQSELEEFLVCGSANATAANGIYLVENLPTLTKDQVFGAKSDKIEVTNFYTGAIKFSKNGPPSGGVPYACVRWQSQDTPEQFPYSLNQTTNLPWLAKSDTLYLPAPANGWYDLNKLVRDQSFAFQIASKETYPWWLISGKDSNNFGQRPNKSYSTVDFASRDPPENSGSSGIFSTMDQLVYLQVTSPTNITFLGVPYGLVESGDELEVDTEYQKILTDALLRISKTADKPDSPTSSQQRPIAEKLRIQQAINAITRDIPWGHFLVNQFSDTIDMIIQIGQDVRINNAAQYTAQGIRKFISFSYMTTGKLKQIDSGASLNHGLRIFPELQSNQIAINFDSFLADILFPFALSFLFPIFVVTLVKEKEDRILIMMKMNGLTSVVYYATHAITFFVLHVLACTIFTVAGVGFSLKFFTMTDPGVYILLFLFWGTLQIALAFFVSTVFSKSRLSLIISFFIVLVNIIISLALDRLSVDGYNTFFYIWPPFAFYRALSLINLNSYDTDYVPYTLSTINPPDNVGLALIALSLHTILFALLTWYMDKVIISEYGTVKPWYFPLQYLGFFKDPPVQTLVNVEQQEDQDVKDERKRVDSNEHDPQSPLIVKHMRKVYPNGKVAVQDVTFAVNNNSIFGLLGPNGAGKTSLISILTGLYPPSQGFASLGGFDINKEQKKVFNCTGVCPQHDILWSDLTIKEHLLFYARLKGVAIKDEEAYVTKAIDQVDLSKFTNRLSQGLSGGEKRRLSIAIALIGDPKVIFLDEPTTGPLNSYRIRSRST